MVGSLGHTDSPKRVGPKSLIPASSVDSRSGRFAQVRRVDVSYRVGMPTWVWSFDCHVLILPTVHLVVICPGTRES